MTELVHTWFGGQGPLHRGALVPHVVSAWQTQVAPVAAQTCPGGQRPLHTGAVSPHMTGLGWICNPVIDERERMPARARSRALTKTMGKRVLRIIAVTAAGQKRLPRTSLAA